MKKHLNSTSPIKITGDSIAATIFHYRKGLSKENFKAETLRRLQRTSGKFWIDLTKPTQEELKTIASELGIHPLVIEDIFVKSTRPKIEQYDGYIFLVTFNITKEDQFIHLNEVNYILGKNYIITASKRKIKEIEAIKANKEAVTAKLSKGQDFLLHHIMDMQVDAYFPILESLEEDMDKLETRIIKNVVHPELIRKVFHVKRQLLVMRRVVSPFRDIVALTSKTSMPNVSKGVEIYFRDVYDHLIRISDMIDTNREIISTILEVHLSATSNRLNEIMKILTVFATILMPLTFIASLYGMNFKNMPEIYHPYGYFVTLTVMGLIAIGMLGWFKHKKWI